MAAEAGRFQRIDRRLARLHIVDAAVDHHPVAEDLVPLHPGVDVADIDVAPEIRAEFGAQQSFGNARAGAFQRPVFRRICDRHDSVSPIKSASSRLYNQVRQKHDGFAGGIDSAHRPDHKHVSLMEV
jgi:hypothetical protein